ncbi:MAG: ABC transporter ATP-binding protein [Saprospiraceae bacterium]|nr:ABC transporter ATP-binding protein [Saprospiraceae bacterium]HMW39909.1 ABC transporter ATP-binding protein [Saprospiraceae bacterium]HMX88129.1 ABC transporter ATP-binding protein [Saprospiraceae bacterium]HMZ38904.1 ABC transporter ATP-binding protein [Saprospiraceae bacterium]HNA64938.1 ABC transporter ATP-binding protein [Saprospiraceae bacterium]
MISIDALSKKFGRVPAVRSVSLELQQAQLLSLIGPNGSGKTTLIKCILGLVVPTSGTILFRGQNIQKDTHYRSFLGYMPQMGRFPDHMKVRQLFELMRDLRKKNKSETDTEIFESFRISDFENKGLGELSGGMRQKVSAALAFLFHPDLLILDEPTAGLDPISSEILKAKILKEHQNGKLIIITSHILSDIEDITTHVAYMQEGEMLHYSSVQELHNISGENSLSRAISFLMTRHQKN